MQDGQVRLACWAVRDTGLATAPPRFRRLAGLTRHHRGEGEVWPGTVVLEADGDHLLVEGVGSWPLAEVSVERVAHGPPVTFVVRVPGSAQLLAAPAGPDVEALLAALGA